MTTFFLFLISSLFLIAYTSNQLKFVIEIYRHGARGPTSNYWNQKQQKYQQGQLLPSGMRQHYILGQELRQQYIEDLHFLSPSYNWTQLYVQSTDVNRTLMSAASHLYGLYPPGTGPMLPENLPSIYQLPPYTGVEPLDDGTPALPNGFQPIPVNTLSQDQDQLLNAENMCPRNNKLQTQYAISHSEVLAYIQEQFKETSSALNTMLNRTTTTIENYGGIFDVFIADYYENWPLPPNLTQTVWNNVTFYDTFRWFFKYGDLEGTRLLTTPVLKYYIQNLDSIVNNLTNYPSQWISLSCHDNNLAPLAIALNFSDWKCQFDLWFQGSTDARNCVYRPYFSSNIFLELFQNETSSQYFVKIQYNGDYQYLCDRNSYDCSYSEFRQRILNWVVPNFKKGCQVIVAEEDLNFISMIEGKAKENLSIIQLIVLGLVEIIIIGLILWKICRNKTKVHKIGKDEIINIHQSNDQYVVDMI